MARLVNYTCDACKEDQEELFLEDRPAEWYPETNGICEKCGKGTLKKNDVKDNGQVHNCFSGYC